MSDSREKDPHISEQCDADQQTSAQQQTDTADRPGADVSQSDFRNTVRDDALAAAEKGLEAARAALAAAEKRLAEAQREAACRRAEKSDPSNAIPVEPAEGSPQRSEACANTTYDSSAGSSVPMEPPVVVEPMSAAVTLADQSADATMTTEQPTVEQPTVEQPTVEQSPVGYAVPQGAPQTPASAPYSYSSAQGPCPDQRTAQGCATQGYASQSQPGACSQMPPNQDGAGSFSQSGAPSSAYQQPYQAYQPQGQPNANQAYAPYDTTYQQQSVPRQPPVQPHYAPPLASRDHVAAGLLAIFLGGFGIHKFYLGYNTQGFIMLALGLIGGVLSFGLALGVVWIIAFIEGIIYLVKPQSEFERTYIYGKREWF
ncbi:MAG: NINE protein [Eggerthellaceae bacterium]